MNYRDLAQEIARQEGVDPDLYLRLVQAESGFNPEARSSAGAIGLAQLMPGTAGDLNVDPLDPEQNLRGGARYLRQQLDRFKDPRLALAAYNAGPATVARYGAVPPWEETQNYVNKILGPEPMQQQEAIYAQPTLPQPQGPTPEPLRPPRPMIAAAPVQQAVPGQQVVPSQQAGPVKFGSQAWMDRTMANPLFHAGLAMMSGENFGSAIMHGVSVSQQIRQNRLDNQIRLAELQARLSPSAPEPTARQRDVFAALGTNDPNDPRFQQLMLESIRRPAMQIQMPSQAAQGFEKLPGYIGQVPGDPGAYYALGDDGQPMIRRLPGAGKSTQAEREAGYGLEERSGLHEQMMAQEEMFDNPRSHLGQLAAQLATSGGAVGAAFFNAMTPDENQQYMANSNRMASTVVKDLSGTAASDQERRNIQSQITVRPGDTLGTIRTKQAIRAAMNKTMANKGRAILTVDEFNTVANEAKRAQEQIGFTPSIGAPAAQQQQKDEDWAKSLLGIK